MLLDPSKLTVGDLCGQSLRECGAIGAGQTPTGQDLEEAQFLLQTMLQQWQNQRWLVYHLVTMSATATGQQVYTVGPGGSIDTNAQSDLSPALASQRPDRIESAFLRQLQNQPPNQIDYPLVQLPSMEDYNRIALKSLVSFPGWYFYDPAWPLGKLNVWPVPNASIYGVFISIKEQLPASFASQASIFNIPYEYYAAMLYNLAERLRPKYGIPAPPPQIDTIKIQARLGRMVVRGSSTAIANLVMPREVLGRRRDGYNIFSDQFY